MPLEIGDTIKDNDPRCKGTTRIITGFTTAQHDVRVILATCRRPNGIKARPIEVKIRTTRIHTDGRARRSCWNRV